MSTFTLPAPWTDVIVKLPKNLSSDELMSYTPFKNWLSTLHQSLQLQHDDTTHAFHDPPTRFRLVQITVQSVDRFGENIGFMKMATLVQNDQNEKLPGIVFMRGGSVAILMIIRPLDDEEERFVIMTQQPRIPAGSLSFFEIPAGMIDKAGTFAGAAAQEIKEETGLSISQDELIDMTGKALANTQMPESFLQKAMYPSPGGSDEYIALFLWERAMSRMDINELRNRLAGVQNEKITVKLVKYGELWKEGARDAKTLAALALYEGLAREGTLYDR